MVPAGNAMVPAKFTIDGVNRYVLLFPKKLFKKNQNKERFRNDEELKICQREFQKKCQLSTSAFPVVPQNGNHLLISKSI